MLRWQCFISSNIPFMCFVFSECALGHFGIDCQHKCECENGGVCDRESGRCSCPAGWMGTRCEMGKKHHSASLWSYHNFGWKKMTIGKMTYVHLQDIHLFPFCVFWSACTQGLYGPGCKEHCRCDHNAPCHHITGSCMCPAGWRGSHCEKSNFPQCLCFFCQIVPCWQTHHNSFVLFQFVYPVHMGSGVLSDATVLGALPVTMWLGSVAAHLVLLVTAVSEVSDYL